VIFITLVGIRCGVSTLDTVPLRLIRVAQSSIRGDVNMSGGLCPPLGGRVQMFSPSRSNARDRWSSVTLRLGQIIGAVSGIVDAITIL